MASKCHDILPNLTKAKGQPGTHRHDARKGIFPWNEILSKTHFLDGEWNLQIMKLLSV